MFFDVLIPFSPGLTYIFTTVVTLFILFYLRVRKKHSYWESQGIKGPKPTFLIGNTFDNLGKPVPFIHFSRFKKYGKIFGTYDGLEPHLVVGEPKIIKEICVKEFHVFPEAIGSPYVHPVEQNFLLNMYGNTWKRNRSLAAPTFTPAKMRKMFEVMKICLNDAMKKMDSSPENGVFDPKYFWGHCNMDLIARCCFATSLNTDSHETSIFYTNFKEFFEGNALKLLVRFTAPVWFSKMLRLSLFPAKNLEFFRDLSLKLIAMRKKENSSHNDFLQLLMDLESEENVNEDEEHEKRIDENSSPVSKTRKLNPEEIVGQSVLFLVAGYETTSTLLTWSSYRLALNPDVQERLYEEISSHDFYDYETLNSMTYLEAFINEALRIDPPLSEFTRVAHQDYTIPDTKSRITKGTLVTIPVYSIHHNPEYYPEPDVFNPERFLNSKDKIKPFTFLPFGAGPRICLGMRFALLNAKLSLCVFLKKYRLFAIPETPIPPKYSKGTIILAADDLKVGVANRH